MSSRGQGGFGEAAGILLMCVGAIAFVCGVYEAFRADIFDPPGSTSLAIPASAVLVGTIVAVAGYAIAEKS